MTPPRIDTHTHTVYCGHAHATMTVDNSVAAAEAAGLEALYITEHLHEPAHLSRIASIRADLATLRPSCEVLVGCEVDADPEAADGSLMAPVDGLAYVIASTHHYPGSRKVWNHVFEFEPGEKRRLVADWFRWAERIVTNPRVHTFAHPGVLISRNGLTGDYLEVLDSFHQLFAVAAECGTAVEINDLAGKKMTPAHRASYHEVIRAAAIEGCRLIFASDAHKPDDIAKFTWALEIAAAAGIEPHQITVPRALVAG